MECDFCNTWVHCQCDKELPLALYDKLRDFPSPAIKYCCPKCRLLDIPPVHPPVESLRNLKSVAAKTSTDSCPVNGPPPTQANVTSRTGHNNQAIDSNSPRKTPKPVRNIPIVPQHIPAVTSLRTLCSTSSPKESLEPVLPLCSKNQATNTPRLSTYPTTDGRSIIVFNMQEATATSLAQRELTERNEWEQVCTQLQIQPVQPVYITRLRTNRCGGTDMCRPAKLTFTSAEEAERVLLLASALRDQSTLRIKPDFPWAIREARRQIVTDQSVLSYDRSCSVTLHGVPEHNSVQLINRQQHDIEQWNYIAQQLGLTRPEFLVWSINRLPRPGHLSGIAHPRLLRVTFLTPDMKSQALHQWYNSRHMFSSDIRMHPDRPRNVRSGMSHHSPANPQLIVEDISTTVNVDPPVPKNWIMPIPLESA